MDVAAQNCASAIAVFGSNANYSELYNDDLCLINNQSLSELYRDDAVCFVNGGCHIKLIKRTVAVL